jgi:polyhydroxyalkanoate synthesis regulator protein
MTRKNLAAFTQALGLFSPFAGGATPPNGSQKAETPVANADIDELKAQLTEMRRRLDSLTEKS